MELTRLFEIFNPIGEPVLHTDYESCIDYTYLDSMAQAGYRFKVAGKYTARTKVQEAVNAALRAGIGYPIGGRYPQPVSIVSPFDDKTAPVIYNNKSEATPQADPAQVREAEVPVVEAPKVAEPVTYYPKYVRCVNTGKIYPNQSAAAKDLHIDPAQVSDSIKTGRPRSGYTFEKVPTTEVVTFD